MSSQGVSSDSARPSVVKSKSSPWLPRFPSKETLSSAHKIPSVGIMPLRKRHSGVVPSSPLTPPTPSTPSLPPLASSLPPARNPARTEQTVANAPPPLPPKSKSRPSTASSRDDVTPGESQPSALVSTPTSPVIDRSDGAPTPTLKSKPSSVHSGPPSVGSTQQPSVRSRSSSTATGLVEEVTPWELYPPIPEKNTKYHIPIETSPAQTPTTASPPPLTATGLVEDVTPWELAPPPQENSLNSPHTSSQLASVDETSTLVSFDTGPRRAQALSQLPPSTPSLALGATSSQEFQQHKVQKTGPTEDVTPWELEPGPGTAPRQRDGAEPQLSSSRGRSSLTIAQVEEVTPWELYPVPSTPPEPTANGANGSSTHDDTVVNKKSTRPGRPPSTSGSSKTLSDLGFVRPRRSTGKSSNKNRQVGSAQPVAGPHQASTSSTPVQSPHSQLHDHHHDADDEMPRQSSRPRASSVTQRVGIKSSNSFNGSTNSPVAPALTKPSMSDPTSKVQHKFSTADRVILRELRFMQDAHDAEFVIKGKGHPQQGGGVTAGKVHHAHREDLAPYPRCYESRIQDLDIWETLFCHQMCESWTWHVFQTPPTKVLDIGCGTGTWISSVAMIWPNCHFWGIDLVPTQPDYAKLGDRDLASRVKWVHANFLEGLPFEDEQFDFIHVKRIALGVPENKWDALFEEFARVLKPGGALEMIEEDLFFPGKPNDSDENADSETEVSGSSRRSSLISNEPPNVNPATTPVLDSLTPVSMESGDLDQSPMTSVTNLTPLAHMPSRPSSPPLAPDLPKHVAFTETEHSHGRTTAPPSPRAPGKELSNPDKLANASAAPPHSRVIAKPSLQVKTGPNLQNAGTFANSAASFLGTVGNFISSPNPNQKPTERGNGFGVRRLSSGMPSLVTDSPKIQSQASFDNIPGQPRNSSSREPYLLRSYKASRNPRDHTILEVIYSEMLSSRFINITPLSLLTNYLEYHFVDVRTHPPLLYTFPPTALLHSESRFVTDSESEPESSEKESSDEGRGGLKPKPSKTALAKDMSSGPPRSRYRCVKGKRTGDTPENDRWLTKSGLLKHQSPYITLDGSRSNAYSPADKSVQPAGKSAQEKAARRKSSLPNATLNIDLRSLNMHLYLRAMEVLGCSEPMWEWVTQYQERLGRKNGTRTETAGRPIKPTKSQTSLNSAGSGDSSNSVMSGIADMTRDDFEILLSNFELDMQDQASVDYVLQERMDWHVFSSPRDTRRKAFDEACRKWDKWVLKQEKRARIYAHRQSHHHGKNRHDVNDNGHGNGINGTPETPHDPVHLGGDLLAARREHSSGNVNGKQPSKYEPASLPSPIMFNSSSLPPDKRLSRSMRVFVTWKPRDPSSPNQAVSSIGGP